MMEIRANQHGVFCRRTCPKLPANAMALSNHSNSCYLLKDKSGVGMTDDRIK